MLNAKTAGVMIQPGFTPCRGRSPTEELKLMMTQVNKVAMNIIEKLWVVPDDIEDFCSWSGRTAESNCQYLKEYIEIAKKEYGISVGVGVGARLVRCLRVWDC